MVIAAACRATRLPTRKSRRHEPRALVQQLVERVLAVGAGLAPDDRRRSCTSTGVAVAIDALAVALHVELLQIGRQPLQVLVVRQHRVRLGAEEVGVPDAEQAEHDRQRSARAARCGSARPSRARRRAAARSGRSRRRARSAGRSTTTASSGRRPSPRTRTCSPARCRTSATSRRRWSRRRRSAWRPPRRPSRAPRNHSRAERALAIVSCVVKVFDATMNSVVAGSAARAACRRGARRRRSRRNAARGPSCAYGASACVDHRGPEVRSADADVHDVGDAQAGVAESSAPPRTASENARMCSSAARTSGITSRPSTSIGRPDRCAARRAARRGLR